MVRESAEALLASRFTTGPGSQLPQVCAGVMLVRGSCGPPSLTAVNA